MNNTNTQCLSGVVMNYEGGIFKVTEEPIYSQSGEVTTFKNRGLIPFIEHLFRSCGLTLKLSSHKGWFRETAYIIVEGHKEDAIRFWILLEKAFEN